MIHNDQEMREFTHALIDAFEEFLEERGIDVPNDEKIQSPDSASMIYGSDYGELSSALADIVSDYGLASPELSPTLQSDVKDRIDELMKEEGLNYAGNAIYMDFPATNPNGTAYQGPGSVKISLQNQSNEVSPLVGARDIVNTVDAFDPAVTANALAKQFSMGIPEDISKAFDEKLERIADKLSQEFDIERTDQKGLDVNVAEFLAKNHIEATFPGGWDMSTTFRDLADARDKYDLGRFRADATLAQKNSFLDPVWSSLQARIEREKGRVAEHDVAIMPDKINAMSPDQQADFYRTRQEHLLGRGAESRTVNEVDPQKSIQGIKDRHNKAMQKAKNKRDIDR